MRGIVLYTDGQPRATVDVSRFGTGRTPFPRVLVLEQSANERILVDALKERHGVEVEWGVRFEGMTMNDNDDDDDDGKCVVKLKHGVEYDMHNINSNNKDGQQEEADEHEQVETAVFDWVCGCDGARSPVRHALNLSFEGGTYAATFYVADVSIAGDFPPRDYGCMFLSQSGFALSFPMCDLTNNASEEASSTSPIAHRFRLLGAVPSAAFDQPGWLDNPDFSVVRSAFETLTNKPLDITTPSWFSAYSVHHRKVSSFRSGRGLLAGDAAHVHSPAGGQGMNTGLLDAHNLGWKLALVTQGIASPKLLDSYNEERERFARELLKTTDSAFNAMAAGEGNAFAGFFRYVLLPFVMSFVIRLPFFGKMVFERMSQTAVNYRDCSMSRTGDVRAKNGSNSWGMGVHPGQSRLKAGDRFPYFNVATQSDAVDMTDENNGTVQDEDGDTVVLVDTADLLKQPTFVVLDFSAGSGADACGIVDELSKATRVPMQYYACSLALSRYSSSGEQEDKEGVGKVAEEKGVSGVVYVVRPDMYVGMVDGAVDKQALERYLRECVHVTENME